MKTFKLKMIELPWLETLALAPFAAFIGLAGAAVVASLVHDMFSVLVQS